MAVGPGDIVFTRDGRPSLVTRKDPQTGNLSVNRDFERVQSHAPQGVINGLEPQQRAAFRTVLDEAASDDKKAEIENLIRRIAELKKEQADPRMLKYLEGELIYRMSRERYTPEEYMVDKTTLVSY